MAGIGRNEPCPCGSGWKVKRCCGKRRGPSETELARAFLASEAHAAAAALVPLSDAEFEDLWEELPDLPARDLSLQLALPDLVTSELERLLEAVADDDPDDAEEVLPSVLAQIDTPLTRASLAKRVLSLRDAGRLDSGLAAAALLSLGRPSQTFLRASLLEAVAVAAGAARTPSGLIVAAA